MLYVSELCHAAAKNSVQHGFWDDEPAIASGLLPVYQAAKIALMHSELSEVLEAIRVPGCNVMEIEIGEGGKPEGVPIELADVAIRLFDFCGRYGIPLDYALRLKMEFNASRPPKHGKAF